MNTCFHSLIQLFASPKLPPPNTECGMVSTLLLFPPLSQVHYSLLKKQPQLSLDQLHGVFRSQFPQKSKFLRTPKQRQRVHSSSNLGTCKCSPESPNTVAKGKGLFLAPFTNSRSGAGEVARNRSQSTFSADPGEVQELHIGLELDQRCVENKKLDFVLNN